MDPRLPRLARLHLLALWPPLIERFILLSGGECTVALPSGAAFSVPDEYCLSKVRLSPLTHPSLLASPLVPPDTPWSTVPRLRRGPDVSGYVFLLTTSIIFLADQLMPSLRAVVTATVTQLAIWVFALGTTSVYFHTPLEKWTGHVPHGAKYYVLLMGYQYITVLGLAGYGLTRLF